MTKSEKVAIISTGMTEFGDLYEYEITGIANIAIHEALNKINLPKKEIESLYVGNMGSHLFEGQENLGNLIATYAGFTCPAFKIQAADASGAVAVRNAVKAIQSGSKQKVMVLGVEKMTEATKQYEAQLALASGLDTNWETRMGATMAALFAIMAKAHMRKYGTTREQMAQVVVKNHYNASLNPKAQYQNRVRVETVLNSKMLADPIRLFDATSLADGAAAIILASEEVAYSYDSEPVFIHQVKQGFAPIALHLRDSLTDLSGTEFAAQKAYKDMGISAKNISVAEVHDIFSIAEILAIEALGLVEKGQGGPATENGDTSLKGSIPVNPSGGLKGRGAPLGAAGVAQIIELYDQFKGTCDERQIKDIEYGLAHSMGGSGGTSVVSILGR